MSAEIKLYDERAAVFLTWFHSGFQRDFMATVSSDTHSKENDDHLECPFSTLLSFKILKKNSVCLELSF